MLKRKTKDEARSELEELDRKLRVYVEGIIKKMERLADDAGIIYSFEGLPPFDSYGNSGLYFPKRDSGHPWFGSDYHEEYNTNEDGVLLGWVSSNTGC